MTWNMGGGLLQFNCPPKRGEFPPFSRTLCAFPIVLDRDVSFTLIPVDDQMRPIPNGMSREMLPHIKVVQTFRKLARPLTFRTTVPGPRRGQLLHFWDFQIGTADGIWRENFDPALTVGAVRLFVERPGDPPRRRYLISRQILQMTVAQRGELHFCGPGLDPTGIVLVPGTVVTPLTECKTGGRALTERHPAGLTPAALLPVIADGASPVTWGVQFLTGPGTSVPVGEGEGLFIEFDLGDANLPLARLDLDRSDLVFLHFGPGTGRRLIRQEVTLSNTGRGVVTRDRVTITGADAGQFRLRGSNAGRGFAEPHAPSTAILPGGFETFRVEYAPTRAPAGGRPHRAAVEIRSDPGGTMHRVNLTGTCMPGCP